MDDLSNFQTFRRPKNTEQHRNRLQEIANQLQNELRMTIEKQQVLRRANDKLTKIIVKHNNQHEDRNARFIRYVEQFGRRNQEKSTRRSIAGQDLVSHNSSTLRRQKSTKKHNRVKTETSDQNDFLAINCSSSVLTRKEVKQKLKQNNLRDKEY